MAKAIKTKSPAMNAKKHIVTKIEAGEQYLSFLYLGLSPVITINDSGSMCHRMINYNGCMNQNITNISLINFSHREKSDPDNTNFFHKEKV